MLHPVADLVHGARLDPHAERPDQEPVGAQGPVVNQSFVHDVVVQDVAQSFQPGGHALGVAPLEPLVQLPVLQPVCGRGEEDGSVDAGIVVTRQRSRMLERRGRPLHVLEIVEVPAGAGREVLEQGSRDFLERRRAVHRFRREFRDVVELRGRRDPARVEMRDHRAGGAAHDHSLGGEHLDQSRKVLAQDDLLKGPAQVDADRGLGEVLAGHVEEHAEPLDEGLVIPLDEIEPAPRRGGITRIVERESREVRPPRRVQSVDAAVLLFHPAAKVLLRLGLLHPPAHVNVRDGKRLAGIAGRVMCLAVVGRRPIRKASICGPSAALSWANTRS